ncbi:two-component regulator propeller domain-containing protein, partial [Enterococcus casseliflavus]|uniref:two-component regulator propeller domain-containing protein n=1 Tax=Enterococcus casseliflavus TaxID=37734 RepID=UPI003D102F50
SGAIGFNIMAIHQDKTGEFWVGTAGNGLIKFDAETAAFATYTSTPDNAGTISSDFVTAIVEDSASIMWVGTRSGLNRFDKSTG